MQKIIDQNEITLKKKTKKIKELVDTPEKIWVALEQHNYLNASDMYLEAYARYEQLRTGDQDVQLFLVIIINFSYNFKYKLSKKNYFIYL